MQDSGKQKFLTESEARASILQARHFYDVDTKLDVYQCRECQFWHITSC